MEKLRRREGWAAVLFILMAAAVYYPALQNGFVGYDDSAYLAVDPTAGWMGPHHGQYTPLVFLSFALEKLFFGMDPFFFHATNILLHSLNTFFIFLIVGRLGAGTFTRILATLFFAVHPLHAEAVAWVTSRKDLLYAFFFFASFFYWIKWTGLCRIRYYVLSFSCFLFSLLSKPMAVSLPAVLLLYEIGERGPTGIRWKEWVPFAGSALITLLAALHFHPASAARVWSAAGTSQVVYNISIAPFFYLFKLCWPVRLSALYPVTWDRWDFGGCIVVMIVLLTGVAAAIKKRTRDPRTRRVMAAVAFYFVALAPALPLFRVTHSPVADRYAYVASAGWCWAFAETLDGIRAGLAVSPAARFFLRAALITGCLSLATLTWVRSSVWRDTLSLWDDVISKYKNVEMAYLNRGEYYHQVRQYDKALADMGCAIALAPDRTHAFNNRGSVYYAIGDYGKAVTDFNRALELDPEQGGIYYNKARALSAAGRQHEALENFQKAKKLGYGDKV